ncbi:MAG: Gfo/Idh/MocA family oxidoreductase [Opitutaceae bacterium]
MNPSLTRRQFLKNSSAAAAVAGLYAMTPKARAQSDDSPDIVRVAAIGCGGRMSTDLKNFIEACTLLGLRAEITALADAFPDQTARTADRFGVPAGRCFFGFGAYREALKTDAEFVLLATPPNFRPLHLEAALEADKHVFMEKPVAVDPAGCRKVIELGGVAERKRLAIVAGTQRRHELNYLQNAARVQAGAIGQILGGAVYWNGTVPWIYERQPGWSDAEYLARNWVNFWEMSGDHITEQHVHNLDVANWFIGRPPESALGMGGRARRESGNQYDFFSVDYDYGNGVHINSQCRQISGCYDRVGEFFRGTKGEVHGGGRITGLDVPIPDFKVASENGTVQEMVDLINSVIDDQPLNEARQVAESTATAIMGRLSAYTGEIVRWSDMMLNPESEFYSIRALPAAGDFETGTVILPPENTVALPGDGEPIRRRG